MPVPVPVVNVRVVRMTVRQWFVPVPMAVNGARGVGRPVGMLVMRVVCVHVLMFHRLVGVLVLVPLGEVQNDPRRHQERGDDEAAFE